MEDSQQHQQARRLVVSLKSPMAAPASSCSDPTSPTPLHQQHHTAAGPSGAGSTNTSPKSLASGLATRNPFFDDDPFESPPVPLSAPAASSGARARKDRGTRRSADVLLHVRMIDDGARDAGLWGGSGWAVGPLLTNWPACYSLRTQYQIYRDPRAAAAGAWAHGHPRDYPRRDRDGRDRGAGGRERVRGHQGAGPRGLRRGETLPEAACQPPGHQPGAALPALLLLLLHGVVGVAWLHTRQQRADPGGGGAICAYILMCVYACLRYVC